MQLKHTQDAIYINITGIT